MIVEGRDRFAITGASWTGDMLPSYKRKHNIL